MTTQWQYTIEQLGQGHTYKGAAGMGGLQMMLNDKAKEQLKQILPLLMGKRQKIEIRGHARQRGAAAGAETDVWQRSYARCLATMKYLTEAGIEGDRMRLSQAGPNEPRTIRGGAENQTQNSFVDIIVLPELADDYFGSREERASVNRNP